MTCRLFGRPTETFGACNLTCRFTELIIDAQQPRQLAEFWCEVLGYHIVDDSKAWIEIAPWASLDEQPPMADLERAAGVPSIIFVPSDDVKDSKNRLHIDVLPIDQSHEAEIARVIALGARTVDVGQGPDVEWTVLADPEGNEFCIGNSAPENG
jgi:catechol 2,3-dioxygenase-like lactoylglutathione lyase family enzyme